MTQNRLREIRRARGLSGTAVAEAIGISPQHYYDLEKGERRLNEDLLKSLADQFAVSVDYLLGRTDDPRTLRERLAEAAKADPELNEFWEAFLSRRELKLAFRTLKELDDAELRRVLRIIKAIEEEEGGYRPDE